MTKIPSLALLIAGELLLAYGLSLSSPVSSPLGQALGGAPGAKGPWLIAGGIAGIISGAAGLAYRRAP
jgi:Protein of unknown function (DUF3185)